MVRYSETSPASMQHKKLFLWSTRSVNLWYVHGNGAYGSGGISYWYIFLQELSYPNHPHPDQPRHSIFTPLFFPADAMRSSSRSCSLGNYSRNYSGPHDNACCRSRHRSFCGPTRDQAATRRTNLLRPSQIKRDRKTTARESERDSQLTFADGEFSGTGDVVEGVGGHGVVICVVCAERVVSGYESGG